MAQPTVEATRQELRLKMTYEEYLAYGESPIQSEFVDGEVIVFVSNDRAHQRIVLFLGSLLAQFVEAFNLGEILTAPFEMRLIIGRLSREPDVLFVAKKNLDRLSNKRLEGPADLAVELISDDSTTRDRRVKYSEYEAAGVPEYWVLDSRAGRRSAQFYQLVDGRYQEIEPDAEGRYHSAIIPGFWLRVDWLWQDPLPSLFRCLREIAPDALDAAESPDRERRPIDGGA